MAIPQRRNLDRARTGAAFARSSNRTLAAVCTLILTILLLISRCRRARANIMKEKCAPFGATIGVGRRVVEKVVFVVGRLLVRSKVFVIRVVLEIGSNVVLF